MWPDRLNAVADTLDVKRQFMLARRYQGTSPVGDWGV
jgi:hypothetical protein